MACAEAAHGLRGATYGPTGSRPRPSNRLRGGRSRV